MYENVKEINKTSVTKLIFNIPEQQQNMLDAIHYTLLEHFTVFITDL